MSGGHEGEEVGLVEDPLGPSSTDWSTGASPLIASSTPEKRYKRTSLQVKKKQKPKGLRVKDNSKKITNSQTPGACALMNLMILSAYSSAEEMVASVMVNDPGKYFPILRKTIQLIQSLKKKETNREQKVIFQEKKRMK